MSGLFFFVFFFGKRCICRVCLFVCMHVCELGVCVYVCVCAWRGVLITSSHTCFPRRLSLPSSHAASSKPDPATVVASPFPAVVPLPSPHHHCRQAGLARSQQPPLPLYHRCPSSKTSPVSYDPWEGKFTRLGGCTYRCCNSLEGLLRIRKGDKLLKAQSLKFVALEGKDVLLQSAGAKQMFQPSRGPRLQKHFFM